MPVAQKGAISFGLVYIPIEMYTATQNNDIRFNQLTKDMERVKYRKTCASCKKDLTESDIVKGFQYEKDKYVVITDKDLEKIKTEKDRSIDILSFTDLSSISPVYFEKSYQVVSQKGGEKAFDLLREAMLSEQKVAVGKTVIGTKETMLALIPTKDNILLETLYYYDEIKEIPRQSSGTKVEKSELDMAKKLIDSMNGEFKPEEYKDEYQEKLRDLIQKKIEGKEVVAEKSKKPDNIVNLMDALKASIENNEKPKKRTTRKKQTG